MQKPPPRTATQPWADARSAATKGRPQARTRREERRAWARVGCVMWAGVARRKPRSAQINNLSVANGGMGVATCGNCTATTYNPVTLLTSEPRTGKTAARIRRTGHSGVRLHPATARKKVARPADASRRNSSVPNPQNTKSTRLPLVSVSLTPNAVWQTEIGQSNHLSKNSWEQPRCRAFASGATGFQSDVVGNGRKTVCQFA